MDHRFWRIRGQFKASSPLALPPADAPEGYRSKRRFSITELTNRMGLKKTQRSSPNIFNLKISNLK
jgi:hypothetical protein